MNFTREAIGRNELDAKISGYLLENAWHRSRERLLLQEQFVDPAYARGDDVCSWPFATQTDAAPMSAKR